MAVYTCGDHVKRFLRDMPPADYTLEIDSFSDLQKMLKETGQKSYESQTFEVGGHEWKLSLYPNGDAEKDGKGHISMYLVIAKTLPLGWEVYVNFRLFVFDQINDKFLTIQDDLDRLRRFHRMKKAWGFAKLLPQITFQDASNGYLIRDKCVFGAEIFVVGSSGKGERLTPMKNLNTCSYTWKIGQFSSITEEIHYSEIFTLANLKWSLELYPKGDSNAAGEYLSLYLFLARDSKAPVKVYANFKLTIRDQSNTDDRIRRGTYCFTPAKGCRCSKYISVSDIRNPSKGFLVDDTLIIEAEIISVSILQCFSD